MENTNPQVHQSSFNFVMLNEVWCTRGLMTLFICKWMFFWVMIHELRLENPFPSMSRYLCSITQHGSVDAMNQLQIPDRTRKTLDPAEWVFLMESLSMYLSAQICRGGSLFFQVLLCVQQGQLTGDWGAEVKPYSSWGIELSQCVLLQSRVVVSPSSLLKPCTARTPWRSCWMFWDEVSYKKVCWWASNRCWNKTVVQIVMKTNVVHYQTHATMAVAIPLLMFIIMLALMEIWCMDTTFLSKQKPSG